MKTRLQIALTSMAVSSRAAGGSGPSPGVSDCGAAAAARRSQVSWARPCTRAWYEAQGRHRAREAPGYAPYIALLHAVRLYCFPGARYRP